LTTKKDVGIDLKASSLTKLIMTTDCLDGSFINIMFRYIDTALIMRPIICVIEYQTSRLTSQIEMANNNDIDKGVKMMVKHKFTPPGIEEKILFSSINFTNGRLLCTP
jgi:hypothetical protein